MQNWLRVLEFISVLMLFVLFVEVFEYLESEYALTISQPIEFVVLLIILALSGNSLRRMEKQFKKNSKTRK